MTASRRMVPPLALAFAALGALVVAQLAGALHPRPTGATPVHVSLVPAYEPCTSPNRTHGPPLAFPSCSPPAQASDFLTVGTPDANGAGANSVGFQRFAVVVGTPGVPGSTDVIIRASISDVRCKPATGSGVCNSANAAGGPDYSGELLSNATIRNTDHNNAVPAGGGTDPATLVDIPFPVNMRCASTSSVTIGGTCSIDTSMQAVRPGFPESMAQKRAVVELTQIQISDGGADGNVATSPNTPFAVQGIFIP